MKNELKQRQRNNHLATSAHFYILPLRICASCGAERLNATDFASLRSGQGFPLALPLAAIP